MWPRLRRYGWYAIAVLWVASVVLGYIGFRNAPAGGAGSFWDTLYLSLQLFPLQSGAVPPPIPVELEIARFLAPTVLTATAVGAVLAALRDELQSLALRRLRDHVVVCGLGERGLLLAKAFSREHAVVAIENDEAAHGIGEAREEGVIVLFGDATDSTVLRSARADRARYLVAVGGDDGTNAEIAVDARALLRGRETSLTTVVHVVDPKLCELLRERQAHAEPHRLRFFNVFETGARAWLHDHPPFGGDGPPHLVVVGVGQMGTALALGAARSWLTRHPEIALRRERSLLPRITLVDRAAIAKRELLLVRTPGLGEFCDLEAREMDITGHEFEEATFLFDSAGRCTADSIYVCLDDDSLGLAAALTLLHRIGRREPPVRVVVRMRRETGLAALLGGRVGGPEHPDGLLAFALLDRTCTPELLLGRTPEELVARAIHEDYCRQQEARGVTAAENPVLVGWDELPEGLRESNRRQADHIRVKLDAVGCHIAATADGAAPLDFSPVQVEQLAQMEHDRWMAERLFEGWTYGPVKDVERKTSPYVVPWGELSEEVRELDRDTVRGLPVLLAEAGFHAVRNTPEDPRG